MPTSKFAASWDRILCSSELQTLKEWADHSRCSENIEYLLAIKDLIITLGERPNRNGRSGTRSLFSIPAVRGACALQLASTAHRLLS